MTRQSGLLIILALMLVITACSDSSKSPTSYKTSGDLKRLEPAGNKVLHGAGQDMGAFAEYNMAMGDDIKPILSMYYVGLKDKLDHFFKGVQSDLYDYGDDVIPQIGLYMTMDGHPEKAFDHEVAEGKVDYNIEILVNELKALNRPVFLRIGYEFNGEWNGYKPESYKQAFIRITKAIREAGLDQVATVWNYSPDANNKDFMSFYPGDEYVDWWGVDIFEIQRTTQQDTIDYMNEAEKRGYPVMIGEVTPRFVGVTDGMKSWDTFFKPFFEWVDAHKGIKAICYINWQWSKYPNWSNWGDARLQTNEVVLTNYLKEMQKDKYIHSRSK
ncbi:glycosyl hydrolase [Paenibacillus paeoniae]|uniref:GH26 domain-containing protein n=1 Tax=Paenibacillus paeoniae TaxID=2292705 RepID=A0A371PGQ2_9BACL|nr:glycosyl hydrolase [Paenibacillus paeoniae]REK75131.1 hypothetical protein DX130_15985 [Paenibacillus paeoniae]